VSVAAPASVVTGRRSATAGIVAILLASAAFGISGPLAKVLIQGGLGPLHVTWLRITGSAVFLVVLAVPAYRRGPRPSLIPLAGFGLAAVGGVQACYFLAVSRLPVGIALLLEFMGPVIVVAWIRWVRRAPLPPAAVYGAVLSLIGLAFVVEVWTGLRLDGWGLVAGLLAAACQASYFLGGERLLEEIDTRVVLAVAFVAAAVALGLLARPWEAPWPVLAGEATLAGTAMPAAVVAAALVLSTVLAYLLGLLALRLLSAPVTGAMAYSEVVVAALAAWALLGERLTTIQLIGGAIVIIGVATAQRAVAARPGSAPVPATAESP
jgi:drug/metabolite transporter (DMT)-like permease